MISSRLLALFLGAALAASQDKSFGPRLPALAQDKPVKIRFDVEHLPAAPQGKPRPLKPEEIKAFEQELRTLPGVKEAACTESTVTLTLNPEAALKLSELRAAGKKTLGNDAGKPVIVFNSIKAEGHVTITLHLEKNQDKVKDALKAFSGVELMGESGEDYECRIKAPGVSVLNLVKAVAQKAGVEYKVFEILKNITWHGTAKEAGK